MFFSLGRVPCASCTAATTPSPATAGRCASAPPRIGGIFRSGRAANHVRRPLQHLHVGLPARVAGVQHQEQQVRLLGRLARSPCTWSALRPGVAVADRVQQHQPRRDARRLQLVARRRASVAGSTSVRARCSPSRALIRLDLPAFTWPISVMRHLARPVRRPASAPAGGRRGWRRAQLAAPARGSARRRRAAGRCSARSGSCPGGARGGVEPDEQVLLQHLQRRATGRPARRRSAGRSRPG